MSAVGWVGLVIPHMARLLVGEDQMRLYPSTVLLGASFMVFTDTLARSLTASEIPLGVLTADCQPILLADPAAGAAG
mgnify:CR=1 FL=1